MFLHPKHKVSSFYIDGGIIFLLFLLFPTRYINAQLEDYHGDFLEMRRNHHSGNQVRMSFYNDGHWGWLREDDFGAEWPINSGHSYIPKIAIIRHFYDNFWLKC